MPIEKFMKLMQKEIELFKTYWDIRSSADPTNWPRTMNEADWFDQFTTWLELADKERTCPQS